VLALPSFATAQTTTQFWGSVTIDRVRTENLTYGVEFEPKVLISAPPVPLNRDRVSEVGARFIMADREWFIPLGDPTERFAGRQRVRAGLGYRHSAAWRVDAPVYLEPFPRYHSG
jgi:hypothetical protein